MFAAYAYRGSGLGLLGDEGGGSSCNDKMLGDSVQPHIGVSSGDAQLEHKKEPEPPMT